VFSFKCSVGKAEGSVDSRTPSDCDAHSVEVIAYLGRFRIAPRVRLATLGWRGWPPLPAHAATAMKLRRALLWLLPAILALGATVWFWPAPERVLDGKSERQWIAELGHGFTYSSQQDLVWRSFGDEGIRVLVRGYTESRGSLQYQWQRIYLKLWRRLPLGVLRMLPGGEYVASQQRRSRIVALLGSLDNRNLLGLKAAVLALDDVDTEARAAAIHYFDPRRLSWVDSSTKSALLTRFLDGLKDPEWWIRNNSLEALRGFPEAASVVAPAAKQALLDPSPWTQLAAAEVLHAVAPDQVVDAGAVPVLVKVLANPDPQIAEKAAEMLGQLGAAPEIAVPALLKMLGSTNALLGRVSAASLARFASWPPGSREILEGLSQNPDSAVRERATNLLAAPVAGK
jgi:HEAT repeats